MPRPGLRGFDFAPRRQITVSSYAAAVLKKGQDTSPRLARGVSGIMDTKPKVSVVVSFLNAERFLEEAIESVFAQSFKSWELLLVDDGSSDSSSAIAGRYSTAHPDIVKYLEHPDHRNRGLPASRNLGIGSAVGEYIALLDSDDVWLPNKLERQVAILDSHRGVGMVYGVPQYWCSWEVRTTGAQPDYVEPPGVATNRVYPPPVLLKLMLSGQANAPCPSDWLFRREIFTKLGGFAETFSAVSNMYEDQAFLAKVYLHLPVFVSDECWDRYRIHPNQLCARTIRGGKQPTATVFYLNWITQYLSSQGAFDAETKDIIRRRLWPYHHPILYRLKQAGLRVGRKGKLFWGEPGRKK
ncbi:MAG: glycosyltransferase [Terriglobia bacterium]